MVLAVYKKNTEKSTWTLVKTAMTMLEAKVIATAVRKHCKEIGYDQVKTTIKSFGDPRNIPGTISETTPTKMLYN